MKGVLLSTILSGAVAAAAAPQATYPLPSKDPWFSAPPRFDAARPGDILRVRNAPGNLTATFTNASDAYNILYRTTDTNYKPSYAWTTVFVPTGAKSSSLLSYQIPYNTPDVDAGPVTLLYGTPSELGLIYNDIQAALGRGWYVNVPDFEGPLASFLCGVQEGHATLDSVRATLSQFEGWGLARNSTSALWGYSGGSLASLFALELQVQYAPEMRISGAALGGVPANVNETFQQVTGNVSSPFAALIPAGVVGFATQHPYVHDYLLSQLYPTGPYNASTFLSVRNMSINQAFTAFAGQNPDLYFRDGSAFFSDPMFKVLLERDALLGFHGVPTVPLFIYKAIHDELAPVDSSTELVQKYCSGGAQVLYELNSIGGHLAEETNGDSRALEVLGKMLGGTWNTSAAVGCATRNVAINITDSPL